MVRPRFRPPSSARSTLTSNQDSILFPRNCTDTPYTSAPGSTAISEKISNRRNPSLEPNTPALSLRLSLHSRNPTTAIRNSTKPTLSLIRSRYLRSKSPVSAPAVASRNSITAPSPAPMIMTYFTAWYYLEAFAMAILCSTVVYRNSDPIPLNQASLPETV